jgi:hypothetical protein
MAPYAFTNLSNYLNFNSSLNFGPSYHLMLEIIIQDLSLFHHPFTNIHKLCEKWSLRTLIQQQQ